MLEMRSAAGTLEWRQAKPTQVQFKLPELAPDTTLLRVARSTLAALAGAWRTGPRVLVPQLPSSPQSLAPLLLLLVRAPLPLDMPT